MTEPMCNGGPAEALPNRRRFVHWGLAGGLAAASRMAQAQAPAKRRPRILMITFRGGTEVERGFRDYLANAGVDAEILHRDAERDATKVAAILQEAQAFKPELIYTWGTPVTLAVTGTHDKPASHPLASVREAYNAVFVESDAAGQLMFYGPGAGGSPTASAISRWAWA